MNKTTFIFTLGIALICNTTLLTTTS